MRQGRYRTARDHLYRLLFSDTDLAWKRRSVYLLGHVHLKLGEAESAAYYFDRARGSLPALSDYAQYNLGLALAGAGRYQEARRAFSDLIDGEPTSRLKPHASIQRAEAARAAGAWQEARADYERLLEGWPDFDERPLANLRMGQILEAKGEDALALAYYKASVLSGPTHPAAAEALEKLDSLRESLEPVPPRWTAAEALRLGRALLAAGRPKEALGALGQVRGRRVSSLLKGRAEMVSAKASLALGERKESLGRLLRFTERRPRHPDVPEALYLVGRDLWNLNRLEEARTYLRRLLHRHRSSPFCEQAFFVLGRLYEEQGHHDRSAKAFRELAAAYPAGELAREGLWRMGWNAYRRGRPKEAAKLFEGALAKLATNDWEDEATYWLARSYEESGRRAQAGNLYLALVKRYPHTYYGQRAAWRLKLRGELERGEDPSIRPAPARQELYDHSSSGDLFGPSEGERLERALELAAMGFLADARQELALLPLRPLRAGYPQAERPLCLHEPRGGPGARPPLLGAVLPQTLSGDGRAGQRR
jgi:tetratricopeptide (TPR) repeat protein